MDGLRMSDLAEAAPEGQSHGAEFSLHPETERALTERYTRSFTPRSSELVYEFTRDPGLLHQYFILRDQMFINVWGVEHSLAVKDEYDDKSHILVVRKGNQVVGGTRLTVSTPKHPQVMPMEGDDFNLRKVLPDLNLAQKKYGCISRMAVLPHGSEEDVVLEIFSHLYRKSIALGLSHWFAVSPKVTARMYRQKLWKLGISYELPEVTIPDRKEYEGIHMQFQKSTLPGEDGGVRAWEEYYTPHRGDLTVQ